MSRPTDYEAGSARVLLWLKRKTFFVLLWLLVAALSFSIFVLYALPWEPLLYVYCAAGTVVLIYAAFDYFRFSRRHRLLRELENSILTAVSQLPETEDGIEGDYQTLLRLMEQEKNALLSASDTKYNDTVTYFTLWAHQIKTPIAAMRLLLQADVPPDAEELTGELFRIEQYVQMVLQYLRLHENSRDLVIRKCDVDTVIKTAVRKYARQFIRKKLKLSYDETHIMVLTDEKWLGFVLEQLLSNALKYTNSGTITVAVDENENLTVSDTGIGIAPEDLPRVFESGYTGYNGRMEKKSTGIGLYLCKRVCDMLSHPITITSEKGKGTIVTVGLKNTARMQE